MPGEAGRGPTPKPQAQVLYIGHHWLVPPCVFLNVVSCSEKCRDRTLSCPLLLAAMQASCKGPVTQTRADGRELGHTVPKEAGLSSCFHLLRSLKTPNRKLHRNVGVVSAFREGSKLEPQNILSNVGSGKPCSSWAVIVNLALVSDDPSHHTYIASQAMAWFCDEVGSDICFSTGSVDVKSTEDF